VLSGISATGITGTGATITWTTNEPATGQVDYGLTTAYGSTTTLQSALTTPHSVPLSGLTSSTLYHYRVRSADGAGNLAISTDRTFTTADVTPPAISGISATGITTTGATINWTTSEPANGQVDYGLTTAYGSTTTLQSGLTLPHSVALTGLNPSTSGTLYNYRVRSADGAGNLTVSTNQTFTTAPDTTPPTVSATTPANGATGVARSVSPTATFSENMNPATLTTGTVTIVVNGSTTPLPAVVTYNATSRIVTLNPNSQLAAVTNYVVRVKGGATGAKDAAGNALATDRVWTFTTR
jgi:hypothetical protein